MPASRNIAQREASANRRYIRDIINGLVPSDTAFEPIYAAVEKNGGFELDRLTPDQLRQMASDITEIRMIVLANAEHAKHNPEA